MSAKEMFKELGYKQKIQNYVIYYFKEINIPKRYGSTIFYHINFILKDKEIFISKNLSLEELKAINKQVEELGWDK